MNINLNEHLVLKARIPSQSLNWLIPSEDCELANVSPITQNPRYSIVYGVSFLLVFSLYLFSMKSPYFPKR